MIIKIPGVAPVQLPQGREYMAEWRGYFDPPLSWYKTFSSMQYNIERVPREKYYLLTPIHGRPVYTFDDYGDFIEAAREFTTSLFWGKFIAGVPQYRVHRGPPRLHRLYRYPPDWTWED